MRTELREKDRMTAFVILKSYDGGKHWERDRACPNFTSAASVAQVLRTQNPAIRFRVDVEPEGVSPRRRQ